MNTMEKNKKQLITKNIINEIEKIYIDRKNFKSYDLMEIAGKSIGNGHPCFVIAEVNRPIHRQKFS